MNQTNQSNNKIVKRRTRNKKTKKIAKTITKIAKVEKGIEKQEKKINRKLNKITKKMKNVNIRNVNTSVGNCKSNGTFYDCLMYPNIFLARIPQCTSKTIICKVVRNVTLTANTLGNLGFVFCPQAINDSNSVSTGTSNLWYCNAATYAPTVVDTVGYLGVNTGSPINPNFSGARCVSARIELMPNVSITSASGRGIISMSKVKTSTANRIGPSDAGAGSTYQQLQLQDTMLAANNVSMCEVVKMQGLSANWIPYEMVDILDFPAINFTATTDLATRHPTENLIYGLFTGLPSGATINVKMFLNIELLPDSSSTSSGLFPLIAEYSMENKNANEVLRNVCLSTPNFTHVFNMGNSDSH